jgi:NAD(P)H-dependent FMN reductase
MNSEIYRIIVGTNRVGSNSLKVGRFYKSIFLSKGIDAELVTLENLSLDPNSPSFVSFQQDHLKPVTKFVFILPEYNGSYPGIFKSMIDITDIKSCWPGKKALLVGVATGKGGNIRGLEHVTGVLNYLKVNVMHNKLPISTVDKLMDTEGKIIDTMTVNAIELQVAEFIYF